MVLEGKGKHMRKILCLFTSMIVLLGCACSLKPKPDRDPVKSSSNAVDDDTQIHFDYPDQLKFLKGGTANMTIYRCDKIYYACMDGQHSWAELYGAPEVDIEDGRFIHVEADFDRAYGGVAGYWGNMYIRKTRDERPLTLDEVAGFDMIENYDRKDSSFIGLRLMVKDGKNYLICRDPMRKYRLYDDRGKLLGTYDTSISAAGYLTEGSDQAADYKRIGSIPSYIMRINGVYYAYSRYVGLNTWTRLIDMNYENKPIGFELADGRVIKVNSASVYLVNGGKENYVNVPMFEKMDRYSEITYDELRSNAYKDHWESATQYENGSLYQYYHSLETYLIFYLNDSFYVYHETGCNMNTDEFVGTFQSPEEVNKAIGYA